MRTAPPRTSAAGSCSSRWRWWSCWWAWASPSGAAIDGWQGRAGRGRGAECRRRGPWGPLAVVGFVLVVGGVATRRAYRRLGGPVADLLGAAERLGRGDYDVRVTPGGPRELRSLARHDQRRRRPPGRVRGAAAPVPGRRHPRAAHAPGRPPERDRGPDRRHPPPRRPPPGARCWRRPRSWAGWSTTSTPWPWPTPAGWPSTRARPTRRPWWRTRWRATPPSPPARGCGSTSTVADGLPEIDVDPTRIRQVLANLLSNAVRHTPDGRRGGGGA